MTYDELLIESEKDGMIVKEAPLCSGDGRCNGRRIAIRQDIPMLRKKAEVLAEEMGHIHTGVGNIIYVDNTQSTKQERRARLWAYNKQIGLRGIISAFSTQCNNRYEMAEHLNVTEGFLDEALECYRQIYGQGTNVDNYFVQFEPTLQVYEYISFY